MDLFPEHIEDLRKSGLSDETIQEAGIYTVWPSNIAKKLGWNGKGIQSLLAFPYQGCDGFERFKVFYDLEHQGKKPKYLQRKGSGNHLYIPEGARPILQDISVPLYITEGEKKALKACQEELFCIGLSGLWNWSKGGGELTSDFDLIAIKGREIYIVPDNDWLTPDKHGYKKYLEQAVKKLSEKLHARGATVKIVKLPCGGFNDQKIGLDDYLLTHTIEDLTGLPSEETKIGKKKVRQKPQADRLVEIAGQYESFHDDSKDAYAWINNQAIRVRSSNFKQLLAKLFYESEEKVPNTDSIQQAVNVIEAKALYYGKCIKLHNRTAEQGGIFYYDLADGRAVKVTEEGWSIVESPILFKRHAHQQPQVEPKRGGDINSLFKYINVKTGKQHLLSLVYPISCLVPGIPHPILHVWGDKGSGKTIMFESYKALIDPSKISVLITPKDHAELVQILEHHYLSFFDNISSFPDWQSDLFSQACTGGGFTKRRLYTDDEDVIYQIRRCIGINGINLLISKPDLMDRTVLLHIERIDPSERRELKILMDAFETDKPYLLGCFFDTLSAAMALYPHIKLDNLPRMADFMRWGVAITQALSFTANDFINAYQENVDSQNTEIINGNTLAQAVLRFMGDKTEWNGTVLEAYDELVKLVHIVKEDRTFPKHCNRLRNHLNKIQSNLLDSGIKFTIANFNTEKGVPISFQKIENKSSVSSGYSNSITTHDPHAEDSLKMGNIMETSSTISLRDKQHTINELEDAEDAEDVRPNTGEQDDFIQENQDSWEH